MNFEKTRLLSADIMKLLKQIYSDQSASNLEKDLLKEKLRAMYDAIDEEPQTANSIWQAEPVVENGHGYHEEPISEEALKEEVPESPEEQYEPPTQEPMSQSFSFIDEAVEEPANSSDDDQPEYGNPDTYIQEPESNDPPREYTYEEEKEAEEEHYVQPKVEEEPMPSYESERSISDQAPPAEYATYSQVTRETITVQEEDSQTIIHKEESIEIEELFYFQEARELSDRLSLSPIADLNKALGINDRLLTVNELFGGDYAFFDESFRKLNSMSSFEEAKSYLKENVVEDQDWLNPGKKEKAKRFIKFIKRRYI